MNFLINFIVGAVITISGEQVALSHKSPAPGIAASAPSLPASIPAGREFIQVVPDIPSVDQMKDKV